ncbi:MAG: hypothetical protein LBP37_03605 [Spirochaetaceae bacterium]|nr:hypothetical protein [Spirochaetaceae bacterium]
MQKICLAFILLLGAAFLNLYSAEYSDGRIKLVIDENLCRFSLYYMTDVEKRIYEPLFWEKDKRTSLLSVYVNDKEYKMGSNSEFKMIVRGEKNRPALVFESKFLTITENFSFIRTASSGVSNGVRIDIRIESWSPDILNVGLRLLIDTFLGERKAPPFRTNLRPIGAEMIIDKTSPEQFWVSRGENYGFMGSIFVEGTEGPDFLQFANWKRMNSARYKVEYVPGRSFNYMPFSLKDAAVCYFLDVKPMKRWEQRTMTILLAAEDEYGFSGEKLQDEIDYYYKEYPQPVIAAEDKEEERPPEAAAPSAAEKHGKKRRSTLLVVPMRADITMLREIVNKVDEYIYKGKMPPEDELKSMEAALNLISARYSSVFNTF